MCKKTKNFNTSTKWMPLWIILLCVLSIMSAYVLREVFTIKKMNNKHINGNICVCDSTHGKHQDINIPLLTDSIKK